MGQPHPAQTAGRLAGFSPARRGATHLKAEAPRCGSASGGSGAKSARRSWQELGARCRRRRHAAAHPSPSEQRMQRQGLRGGWHRTSQRSDCGPRRRKRRGVGVGGTVGEGAQRGAGLGEPSAFPPPRRLWKPCPSAEQTFPAWNLAGSSPGWPRLVHGWVLAGGSPSLLQSVLILTPPQSLNRLARLPQPGRNPRLSLPPARPAASPLSSPRASRPAAPRPRASLPGVTRSPQPADLRVQPGAGMLVPSLGFAFSKG